MDRLMNSLFQGPGGRVLKGMVALMAGSITARLMSVVSIPFLTRIYSPEDYGILAIYSSSVAIIGPALTLRYVVSIPLPRREEIAARLLLLSFVVAAIAAVAIALLMLFFNNGIFDAVGLQELKPWWWLLPAGAFSFACFEGISHWLLREKNYSTIAKTQVLQSLLGETVKAGAGIIGCRPAGLLVGHLVSQGLGATALVWKESKGILGALRRTKPRHLVFAFARYKQNPIYILPSHLLMVASMQIPVLLLSAHFGVDATGQFALAIMATALPADVAGESASKAYYSEISKINRKDRASILSITLTVIFRQLLIAIPVTAMIFTMGEWIFTIALGDAWSTAGVFASSLSLYLAFQLVQRPVSNLMIVYGRQRLLLFLNIQRIALVALIFHFGKLSSLTAEHTVLIYSIGLSLHYLICIFVALKPLLRTP